MSGSVSTADKAEPNLTPILDMVFQLITFFMLVISFKTAELDTSLTLPVIGSARPVDTKNETVLVLNIDSKGVMKSNGEIKDNDEKIASALKKLGLASQLSAKSSNPRFEPGDELPTIVVIRANEDTPFAKLYYVIEQCQKNNFLKFALRTKIPKKKVSA